MMESGIKAFSYTHKKNELDSNLQVTYISISEPGQAGIEN
jgi:hypothetical protein